MPTRKHLEKQIEQRLQTRARAHGGTAYKFTSPGRRSVPDRILCCACIEHAVFIEAKAEGSKPTKKQEREMTRLRERGQVVTWVDSYDGIDTVFDLLCDKSCKDAVDS